MSLAALNQHSRSWFATVGGWRTVALFLAKCGIALLVLIPLYLAGYLTPLAIAHTVVVGGPAKVLFFYLCWRILRTRPADAPPDHC